MVSDVALCKTYSLAVLNTGANSAVIRVSISPNNLDWAWDGAEITVAPSAMEVLVPRIFLRYACVSFKSVTSGNPTSLHIWYQAQG